MKEKLPKYEQLMWATIKALKSFGNSATNQELNEKIAEIMNVSEEELDITYQNSRISVFVNRCAWARVHLKKYGAIGNSTRGVWNLTDKGAQLAENDMGAVRKIIRTYWKAKTKESNYIQIDDEAEGLPQWKRQLLEILYSITPKEFENLCQRVLREAGFTKVEVTGKSGDGGIDGVGVLRYNLLSFRISFQCKRYRETVGSSVIRDFRGAFMGKSDKGIIITTGSFSASANKEAIRDGASAIDLVDGDQFCELLKKYSLGVEVVEEVQINPEWFKSI